MEGVGNKAGAALVVAGSPQPSSPELVAALAREAGLVIAVDAGIDACHAAGAMPDVAIGDMDSSSPEALRWAKDAGAEVLSFPPEKDDTDFSLALAWAREHAERIVVTCASGGRVDHQLAVFGCLARFADLSPRVVEDAFECRILSPSGTPAWELGEGEVGRTLSLTALAPGTVASERGMRWELDRREIPCLFDLGISNVVESAGAVVEAHGGVAAAFLLA